MNCWKKSVILKFFTVLVLVFPRVVQASAVDPYEEVNASWERFGAVYSRILQNYNADLDQDKIMRGAIDGMLEELDSYSQFYDEEGLRQLRQDTTGKFAGLGITVGLKDHYPVIIAPIEDTPAERGGLQPGDLIVAVDGRDTYDLTLEEVVRILRGEPGSNVRIRVHRNGGPPDWDLDIEREIIRIKSVVLAEEIQPGIAYISMRQTRFSEDTAVEVEQALKALKEKGVEGAILDLRGNPGGLLSQATQVADLFLPKGAPIVAIRERSGRREEVKRSQKNPLAEDLPLVILIDAGSASAAEIVAGAIQDNDRGVIVGTTSFGKGSVQTIFDLHEVESSALKLTTALYYTPSGRSIHRDSPGSGRALLQSTAFGGREVPVGVVLDLILRAPDFPWIVTALRSRFQLEEGEVEQVLSTELGDLVGKAEEAETLVPGQDNPDSAEKAFYTLKGRKVYGGGGISPDISVAPSSPPAYILEIERHRMFFDFIVDYVSQDSTLARPGDVLELDDKILEEFRAFCRQTKKLGKYRKAGQKELKALRELAGGMGWGDVTRSCIDSLDAAIEREFAQTFTARLEPYIRRGLKRELALRLMGTRASLRTTLEEDTQLQEAIKLLQDVQRYSQVLNGGTS